MGGDDPEKYEVLQSISKYARNQHSSNAEKGCEPNGEEDESSGCYQGRYNYPVFFHQLERKRIHCSKRNHDHIHQRVPLREGDEVAVAWEEEIKEERGSEPIGADDEACAKKSEPPLPGKRCLFLLDRVRAAAGERKGLEGFGEERKLPWYGGGKYVACKSRGAQQLKGEERFHARQEPSECLPEGERDKGREHLAPRRERLCAVRVTKREGGGVAQAEPHGEAGNSENTCPKIGAEHEKWRGGGMEKEKERNRSGLRDGYERIAGSGEVEPLSREENDERAREPLQQPLPERCDERSGCEERVAVEQVPASEGGGDERLTKEGEAPQLEHLPSCRFVPPRNFPQEEHACSRECRKEGELPQREEILVDAVDRRSEEVRKE